MCGDFDFDFVFLADQLYDLANFQSRMLFLAASGQIPPRDVRLINALLTGYCAGDIGRLERELPAWNAFCRYLAALIHYRFARDYGEAMATDHVPLTRRIFEALSHLAALASGVLQRTFGWQTPPMPDGSQARTIPLVDLHCHMEGSIDPDLSFDIQHPRGSDLEREAFRTRITCFQPGYDMFSAAVHLLENCLQNRAAVVRVTADLVARAAEQGVAIFEPTFAPGEFRNARRSGCPALYRSHSGRHRMRLSWA